MNQTISTDTSGSTPIMVKETEIYGGVFLVFALALILLFCAMLYVTKKD